MALEQIVHRRANTDPTATELEVLAIRRQEEEDRTALPASLEEMIAATTDVQSPLAQLRQRYPHNDRLFELSLALEQRIERYFESGQVGLMDYGVSMLSAVQHNDIPPDRAADLAEIQFYIIQELNSLIRQLYTALTETDVPSLDFKSPDDLLRFLSAGRVEREGHKRQMVLSSYGALQRLHEIDPERFAGFSLREPNIHRSVAVVNPFGEHLQGYWHDRLQAHRLYGEARPTQLITWRSNRAAEQLRNAAELITGRELGQTPAQIATAYEMLADWVEEKGEIFGQRMSPGDYDFFMSQLDFSHGDTNQLIDLLNAAETVKTHNPELMLRLLGISPDHDVMGEAERSDLFGSVFHIAVYQTLQLPHPEYAALRETMQRLTQLDVSAVPLQRLNSDQLRMLADRFAVAARTDETGTAQDAMGAAVFGTLLARFHREVSLAYMVDASARTERDQLLERLQVSSPKQFITIVKSLSQPSWDDRDIVQVIADRLEMAPGMPWSIAGLSRYILDRRSLMDTSKYKRSRPEYSKSQTIEDKLWLTSGPDAFTTDEFVDYLKRVRKMITAEAKEQRDHTGPGSDSFGEWPGWSSWDEYNRRYTRDLGQIFDTHAPTFIEMPEDQFAAIVKAISPRILEQLHELKDIQRIRSANNAGVRVS